MRIYPSGNKEGDAVTVRLTKHSDYDRRAMIARMGMAQSCVTGEPELSLQEIGNNGSATLPVRSVLPDLILSGMIIQVDLKIQESTPILQLLCHWQTKKTLHP